MLARRPCSCCLTTQAQRPGPRERSIATETRWSAVRCIAWLGLAVIGLCLALAVSLHFFKFTRLPGLVEPRVKRAVKAEEDSPAFAGNRLHPVVLPASQSFRGEPDIHRFVVVDAETLRLAPDGRELLVGLEHGASLVVVERKGPEILGGHIRRHVQFVSLAAVERIALGVYES